MITGIICEYNPFHSGHKKQLDMIRSLQQGDDCIVCLMSGNYVQRGKPAIIDKSIRAKAAILCGADLVLELPVNAALSSAENFAAIGVSVLSQLCDTLSFGAEDNNEQTLSAIANALLTNTFTKKLKAELSKGISFPTARGNALEAMGFQPEILSKPNNILAIEYYKAIISQNAKINPIPIYRAGNYHEKKADTDNPSATAVRSVMLENGCWDKFVPQQAANCFKDVQLHTISAGERAILAKLRTMSDAEFEALPYGSEGLWRKLMHAARKEATLENVIASVKSKRYTRTRIDRMILCAFLGITQEILQSPPPYVRILAFNEKGRKLLNSVKESGFFINTGERVEHPWQKVEERIDNLYGLFAQENIDPPGTEMQRRVYYHKES